MYLRTLKAVHSAKFFWEEIFMPKSQLGGILYIFSTWRQPRRITIREKRLDSRTEEEEGQENKRG